MTTPSPVVTFTLPPRLPASTQSLASKLATDDAFRASFEANPKAALAQLHIAVPEGLTAKVTLPSKEEFAEAMITLTGHDPRKVPIASIESHWAFLAFLAFI